MRMISLLFCLLSASAVAETRTATFAGGCFWCVEALYQETAGVIDAVSGFTGGTLKNPTYNGNHQGHFEAVEVTFEDEIVTYAELLDLFWRNIDPLDNGGQFCDRGPSYRSAVFYHDEGQKLAAETSKAEVARNFTGQPVHTEIRPAGDFWPVEAYHQDYYSKNPIRYRFYRTGCRRDARLQTLWGTSDSH
jgi:peptide-methionine (S)-S-oxide reductase